MSITDRERGLDEPVRAFVSALQDLHLRAGRPSSRMISKEIDAVSHTTVAEVLGGRRIPSWQIVSRVVQYLGGDEHEFRRLWIAAVDRPANPRPVPRELPPTMRGFVGRSTEMAMLDSLTDSIGRSARVAVISSVSGTAGVGKTALAVQWAHRIRDYFPDGQLFVNLRGFDPSQQILEPATVLHRFLDTLGVPPEAQPVDIDARTALYRSLVADRRMLIILDNAHDAEQIRPLLPGSSTCLVLVTSRNRLPGLVAREGAHAIALDVLDHSEALALLASRIGENRVAAEPVAASEIIERCDRLPLALALVGARALAHPALTLERLAEELRDDYHRLDALTFGDPASDLRTVLSWSYRALSSDAARLFRLIGLHGSPDISLQAAGSLANASRRNVDALLQELTRSHLIAESAAGRYAVHDLLRSYAAELSYSVDSDDERREALERVLEHYLHTAHAAALILDPHRDPVPLPPARPGVIVGQPVNRNQAMEWFVTEHADLLRAVERAGSLGLDKHTWQIAWSLATYLDRQGHWKDLANTQLVALNAEQRLESLAEQARTHRYIGHAASRLGQYNDSHVHLQQALELYTRLSDLAGQANTQYTLSQLLERQAHHAEARDQAQHALELYRVAGHRRGEANALNAVGWCRAHLGDFQGAVTACQEALRLLQALGDLDGEAHSLDSLGYIYYCLEDFGEALACYGRAVELFREIGELHGEANTLTSLGDTNLATGDLTAARSAWIKALNIFQAFGPDHAQSLTLRLDQLTRLSSDEP